MTSMLCGTITYMAPEMFTEHEYTSSVDIYSLAIMYVIHTFS